MPDNFASRTPAGAFQIAQRCWPILQRNGFIRNDAWSQFAPFSQLGYAVISRSAQYALVAMQHLALQPKGKFTRAKEIAEANKIPMPFLWKLLRALTDERLVRSHKGAMGGYELARPAKNITLREIVTAITHEESLRVCVLTSSKCDENVPCPLHTAWDHFCSQFDKATLENLVKAQRGNS